MWIVRRQSQDHLSPCPVIVMLLQSAAGIYRPTPVIECRLRHRYLPSAIPCHTHFCFSGCICRQAQLSHRPI